VAHASHVHPQTGEPDLLAPRGSEFRAGDVLLVGRYPELKHAPEVLRRLRPRALHLVVPHKTHVSSLQLAIWYRDGALSASALGRNAVSVQSWGRLGVELKPWPAVTALDPLTTVWLPRSDCDSEHSRRWRIAIAHAGPVDVGASVAFTRQLSGTGGVLDAPRVTSAQYEVLVEKFGAFLDFPSSSMIPRVRLIARDAGARSRTERLETVRKNIERSLGTPGIGLDTDLLWSLIDLGGLTPSDVETRGANLSFLRSRGLLPVP